MPGCRTARRVASRRWARGSTRHSPGASAIMAPDRYLGGSMMISATPGSRTGQMLDWATRASLQDVPLATQEFIYGSAS